MSDPRCRWHRGSRRGWAALRRGVSTGGVLLLLLQAGAAPAQQANFTSAFVARWNLSHGKYLVDVGQYLEAIEAFNTAFEMGTDGDLRTEALLERANVLAVFLDAPDDAIRVYDELITQYPKSSGAESALYRAGMVLFDGAQYARAAQYFERYLAEYPQGAAHGSVEFLLSQSRSKTAPTSTPSLSMATRPPAKASPTPVAPPSPPGATPSLPTEALPSAVEVRVRILKGHARVRVESEGTLTVTPAGSSTHAVDLAATAGRVTFDQGQTAREVTVRSDRPFVLHAGALARHYRGHLSVRADGGTLVLINGVGIEEYLYGVVTKESVASWPAEALKAQAIASRTYALYQVQHRQQREFDMVDDEGSQVYGGVEGEGPSGRRAVDATRGVILAYRGRPLYAMFTANSGWYTGDPAFVFDQPLPYFAAVPDSHSPTQQLGRWTRSYTGAEIRRKLADIGVELGPIRAIEPRKTCPSGRIIMAAIVDDHGAHVMRTRPTLGRALSLPEILLNVEHRGDQFVFKGGGFGHGVGLSQWGAKDMADKGLTAKDILAFYYRGAELTTLAP